MQDEVLSRIGRCIYCGTTGRPLSREHIVPFGLDGPWVLDSASCTRCAAITSKIENYVLRKHLLGVRAGLMMRTRRPRERPDDFAIEFLRRRRKENRELKVSEQPIFLFLPLYDWPERVPLVIIALASMPVVEKTMTAVKLKAKVMEVLKRAQAIWKKSDRLRRESESLREHSRQIISHSKELRDNDTKTPRTH